MLPGNRKKSEEIERMIRVNQAGEYGAKRIYDGQLAVLKGKPSENIIKHMADQEEEHLSAFNKMMIDNKVRPTALMPVWHLAGFALGAVTALIGEKAAMACTVAVEEVIGEHYSQQLEKLDDKEDSELKNTITKFRADELGHRDIGLENEAEKAVAHPVLSEVIKLGSRAAIWLSTRV